MNMSKYFRTINIQHLKFFQNALAVSFLFFLMCSCNKGHVDDQFQKIEKDRIHPLGIAIDYPREGTIFPPEFPAPEFLWNDTLNASARWHIRGPNIHPAGHFFPFHWIQLALRFFTGPFPCHLVMQ